MSSSDVTTRGAEFEAPAARSRRVTLPSDLASGTQIRRRGVHSHDRFWRDVRRRRLLATADVVAAVVLGLLLPLTPVGDIGLGEVVRCWAVATVGGGILRAFSRWVWRRTT